MHNYKKLEVYKKSYDFNLCLHKELKNFPREELYSLTNQVRRAAYSIGANIAEGSGRSSAKEYARFIDISIGSSKEVEFFLNLSKDFNYLDRESFLCLETKIIEIQKMLYSFRRSLLKKTK